MGIPNALMGQGFNVAPVAQTQGGGGGTPTTGNAEIDAILARHKQELADLPTSGIPEHLMAQAREGLLQGHKRELQLAGYTYDQQQRVEGGSGGSTIGEGSIPIPEVIGSGGDDVMKLNDPQKAIHEWARQQGFADLDAARQRGAGDVDAAMQTLSGLGYGMDPGPDYKWNQYQLTQLPKELLAGYKTVANQGIYGQPGIDTILGAYESNIPKTMDAYNRALALQRQGAARAMTDRVGGRLSDPRRQQMLSEAVYQPSWEQSAMMAANMQAPVGQMEADLLKSNMESKAGIGLQGMGTTLDWLTGAQQNRLWDTSYENKFGPTPAQRALAQAPLMGLGQMFGLDKSNQAFNESLAGSMFGSVQNYWDRVHFANAGMDPIYNAYLEWKQSQEDEGGGFDPFGFGADVLGGYLTGGWGGAAVGGLGSLGGG